MLQEMLNDEQELGRFRRKKGTLQEGRKHEQILNDVRASWVWGYKGLRGVGTRPAGHGLGELSFSRVSSARGVLPKAERRRED